MGTGLWPEYFSGAFMEPVLVPVDEEGRSPIISFSYGPDNGRILAHLLDDDAAWANTDVVRVAASGRMTLTELVELRSSIIGRKVETKASREWGWDVDGGGR